MGDQNTRTTMKAKPAICDYEGSNYEADFWRDQGREYEDRVERIALQAMLPRRGDVLIDIGAGFGRLANLYGGFDRVILFDYSRSLLRQARDRLGRDSRFIFVAGNVYSPPFAGGIADTVVMVRVIHHLQDAPEALAQLTRLIKADGSLVLEFANKRNLKAILRYWVRRQTWSPFALDPVEFVPLNYNFHPDWIERQIEKAGLDTQARRAVSHFRFGPLKRLVPLGVLASLDRLLQPTGARIQLSPSIFVRARQTGPGESAGASLFRCPACRSTDLAFAADALTCRQCGRRWGAADGIYDFKEPM